MEFQKKEPQIILIAGKARSGKNTVAKYLEEEFTNQKKKVVISPYTKYLKQYIEEITNTPIDDNNKPRELLQKVSSELIKGQLKKEDFFIRRQIEDIEIYSYFMDIIIVPDVRFPSEIEVIKKNFPNVISIGVVRENYQSNLTNEQQNDITEIALDNYHDYDFKIKNTEKKTLEITVKQIIQKLSERRDRSE